ncbi:MAG: SBBP repeat-containing protein [Pseudomonadota bacterium]
MGKTWVSAFGFIILMVTAVVWASPVPDTGLNDLNPANRLIASTNEVVPLSGPGVAGNMLQFMAGGHVLGFQSNKAYLAGLDHALSIEFLGTPGVMPTVAETAPATGNMTKAPALSTVRYKNLWDDISLTYESTKDGITESTYHVAPGGDVSRIRLRYNVPVESQADGSLKFKFDSGNLFESSPVAWQEIGEKHVPVTVAFRVSGGEVGFTVGQYDRSYPLIIDPIYQWHTFYGTIYGTYAIGYGIAVDGSGNVYVTGNSHAWNGPTGQNPLNAHSGGFMDIFVLKLNSSGAYQWHTFYGSPTNNDFAFGIAVDGGGNVYTTGYSCATWNGPTGQSPLNAYKGYNDTFVLKLNSSGAYQWHTFYGEQRSTHIFGDGIAVDGSGNVYVIGESYATWGSPLNAYSGKYDIFVLKLNSSGAYQWHTFYGSSRGYEYGKGIAVDGSGNVYVTGEANGTWNGPPTSQNPLGQSPLNAHSGGYVNIFVLKLNSSGAYQWHTFYGPSSLYAVVSGIAVDGSGNVYVTGSSDTTWGSPLHAFIGGGGGGYNDIFVLKLNSSGTYQWHTFYGTGIGNNVGYGIAVDGGGNVYATGYSADSWGSPLHAHSGDSDIFVLKLNSSGTYQWHTFYGASNINGTGYGIAVDGSSNVYVTGGSYAWNGPTGQNPLNASDGAYGIFVLKMGAPTPTPNPIIGSNSIDTMDVVKITDMSGTLPAAGGAVTVRAWDKNGNELPSAGYALPISIFNHGTTSILGSDLEDRFPGGIPAAYAFSVESSKMFITNVNNSFNGSVKVPIIYSNGLSNFVSNSIGTRNTIKVTDMSGTIPASGIAISVAAWDASGSAIPESSSAVPLKLYSHGTTIIAGSSLAPRFPSGTPLTYEFSIGSPKLVISNVKNSVDGTLNISTVYTIGVSNFVSNSIGARNTIYISDFSGTLDTGGAAISVRAWDVSGSEIPEAGSAAPLKLYNHGTTSISGSDLAARFPSGSPMTYEFAVVSSKVVITNVKSSTDGSINIPTVYTSGITNYTTNYVRDLNTIQITDMSGSITAGGASITITARDVDGNIIPESGSAAALKLYNHGTTVIEGDALQDRFPGGVPVTYEFSIGSPSAVVTNLTESSDGTINIPAVFTIGSYGGI